MSALSGGKMAKTLLLADDSVTIQKVVGISFASEDVDLVTVDNGDDAVSRAKEIRPDAILADVVMPGKNGYEVCEAVKADPALSHVPVLLLTGTFEAFDEERAQRCGAAGHVAKPFEAQVLVERVRELFAQSAAAAPAPAPAPPAATPSPTEAPTQNPAASAPPVVAPATASNDDGFDFFDEDLSPPSAAPVPAPPPSPAPAAAAPPRDDAVALSSSEASFAFADEDFGISREPVPAAADPLAGAPPDRTVAIMPDDPADPGDSMGPLPPVAPPTSLEDSFPLGGAGSDDLLTSDLGAPDTTPAMGEDAFDFELTDPGNTPNPGETELVSGSSGLAAAATVLDPKGASSFDVSYSDLGDSPAEPPSPSAQPEPAPVVPEAPQRPPMAPEAAFEPPPHDVEPPGASAQPLASAPAPAGIDAFEPPVAAAEPMAPAPPEPMAPAAPEPAAPAAPEPMAPAAPEAPPAMPQMPAAPEPFLAAPEPPAAAPAPEPPTPEALEQPGPRSDASAWTSGSPEDSISAGSPEPVDAPAGTHDPSALAGMALAEITPRLREELHDTLEKIAWESFGNLTEQIVRQVMERAERVAWEVIPQMAETLIREEIRRMKGESDSE